MGDETKGRSCLYNNRDSIVHPTPNHLISMFWQSHMGEMFAFHATTMANTLYTPIIVFTRTGSMAILLSHYQPSSTIFAFTNE